MLYSIMATYVVEGVEEEVAVVGHQWQVLRWEEVVVVECYCLIL